MSNNPTQTTLDVGWLMTSNALGFQFTAASEQINVPIGGLVVADVSQDYQVFGVVSDIRSDPDAMGKAIAQSANPRGIAGRAKTNPTILISVITVGYREAGNIYRMLPPRPPISLNKISLVPTDELIKFTEDGSYLRSILKQSSEVPTDSLLAACIKHAHSVRPDAEWLKATIKTLVVMLKGDYRTLYGLLTQVADLIPTQIEESEQTEE